MRAPISCQSKLSPQIGKFKGLSNRHRQASTAMGDFTSKKRPGLPSTETPATFVERHFPSPLPSNEKGKQMKDGALYMFIERKPKKSSYFCDDCNVGLCVAVLASVFITPTSRNIYVF